ncbi:MAG: 1-deoxy-D-xylulose-5-phosphate synthase, partial [Clostridia bacterium]|nr:1-deoxy-D-xylulose-5-phosphate synthase [Clostridia bacterium]
IKKLNINELKSLSDEVRQVIIDTVTLNGGHFASNLGTVELIIALFYVFDFPKDKIIFDVGHQSYAYKILSDRFNKIKTIRTEGGLSGFPDPNESEFDSFSVGHAGTSISAGLGFSYARDKLNEDYNVINVVGDASFFNGENLEAITSNDIKPSKFLVVLNDNGMSISKNNNALYKMISKATVTKKYTRFNSFLNKVFGSWFLGKFLKKIKHFLKRTLSNNTFIDGLGLKYVGIFDGHNLKSLIKILTDIKETGIPTLLHIKTVKGKGYVNAENEPSKFHGVSNNLSNSANCFSNKVSEILEEVYIKNDKICAITAGMKDGVGLSDFYKNHPKSVIDVGIAEEFAVTLSAGIAKSGLKPIVFIYSTFLQRGYDQIVHDVCLQNLPVIFAIDRAGLVGSDGKTHQGVFDLSYLTHIPNLTVISPKDESELKLAILTALDLNKPVAIRYPNGNIDKFETKVKLNSSLKWEVLTEGEDNVILAVGPRMLKLAFEIASKYSKPITIINARTVKPLDNEILNKIKNNRIITLEENAKIGGFGSLVLKYYSDNEIKADVKLFGVEDEFVSHATVDKQLEINGLNCDNIIKYLR